MVKFYALFVPATAILVKDSRDSAIYGRIMGEYFTPLVMENPPDLELIQLKKTP
jgi:hypothetical protein